MLAFALLAESHQVTAFRHYGPVTVTHPVQLDSTDVNARKYDATKLLDSRLNLAMAERGEVWSGDSLPGSDTTALHLLGFGVTTGSYFKGSLKLAKAPARYKLFVDGHESQPGAQTFTPGSHQVVIKYLSEAGKSDSLQLSFESDSTAHVSASSLHFTDIADHSGRLCTIEQQVNAGRYSQIDLSPNGRWLKAVSYKRHAGNTEWEYLLIDRQTGHETRIPRNFYWMPRSNRFYYTEHTDRGQSFVVTDPLTMSREVLAEGLPDGGFIVLPTEDRLLYTLPQEGPKELNPDAFEFVHPDDRQPGWRDRSTLALYDLSTGMMQSLTYGYNSHWVSDISRDGRKMLFSKNESRLTERPTTLTSLYVMDLQTLKVDTLVERDGFIASACFSPDAKTVAVTGSPEAFGGIGNTVPQGMTPNMFDYHLYLLDVQSRDVKSVSRDFPGTISNVLWSQYDGQIYFKAEVNDSCSIFRFDPKTLAIKTIEQPEEVVDQLSVASAAGVLAVSGESHDHSWRLYAIEQGKKQNRVTMLKDLNSDVYDGVEVCECRPWTFTNSNGDEVSCRYYLPNGFDESAAGEAQVPMIVYYYGGCSGTLRNFEYTYPWTIWAANGYAVLVVNPSGATGFGQEWAARHVNTAGEDPARDIIEATKTFCNTHSWVNAKKLGCIGASYGGFMTQYLQTVTDIFCCAVSHAGISDHTTYWGYGYWGYSYSEVSMANSYPWSHRELYVDHSPLYNVDKIKSSMLFLHGTDDTNVPYNNSVQMFTALKLLGRDVAMVSIKGENHGIRDPKKRVLWHNATMAWFARCLKDDPTWWEALYPKKTL